MAFVDSRRDDDDEISCPGRGGGGWGGVLCLGYAIGSLKPLCYSRPDQFNFTTLF